MAVTAAGYKVGDEVSFALDVAASELYREGRYNVEGGQLTSEEMVDYLATLVDEFPLVSIDLAGRQHIPVKVEQLCYFHSSMETCDVRTQRGEAKWRIITHSFIRRCARKDVRPNSFGEFS